MRGLVAIAAAGVALTGPAAASAETRGVRDGAARFEVVTPTLIRLEYAADGRFQDGPTFNVPSRHFAATHFRTSVEHGYRVIDTGRVTLRYRQRSGPFTAANTTVQIGRGATGHPAFPAAPGSCTFGTACEAEDGRLNGGESVNYDHTGHTGRGFSADYGQVGATGAWTVSGAPGGDAELQVRYANGGTVTRTLTTSSGTLSLPPTGSWDTWGVATLPLHAEQGDTIVTTACGASDGCNVNLDSVALTAPGAAYPDHSTTTPPAADEPGQLGGWTRGLDEYANQAGTSISDAKLHPGILNRRGWSLLDDTYTALRTPGGWVAERPAHRGVYQDGYLFGYGDDYATALSDLRTLTGSAAMLPERAFGVWFSEFFPYSTSDYENELIPAFRAHGVPLDNLVADTDWKSPQQWDGWNWNPALFPDPGAFLGFAKSQNLDVALNVHAGIDQSDPRFAQAQQTAKGKLTRAAQCFSPTCYRFDWSDADQAKAWLDLHQPFEDQGVRQWWLDWCCTDSYVGLQGLTPDSWINDLYARDTDARGLRGFVLARIGASFEDYRGAPAPGPWGEHRSTVHFTGDTDPTWDDLAMAVKLTPAEGAIGQPYVSHDIGSFKGRHLPDDLYTRWVQLGAFQPILRLHSDHGDRLPWEYGAGQAPATDALRLREALVPYTYSLARQSVDTGLPIARALYLEYPGVYDHPDEYLYGPDVLVAPVTSPGPIATRDVWLPPGRWIDFFTGATFGGGRTVSVKVPLDRMPVFVKAGSVVARQPGTSHVTAPSALAISAYAGGSGDFTLYSDAGEGQSQASARTRLSYRDHGSWSSLTIGADAGHYPGQPSRRTYTVDFVDVSAPKHVVAGLVPLPRSAWSYDAATATLHVRTGAVSTRFPLTISQIGGRAVTRPQPPAVSLSLDPATPMTGGGAVTATLTNAGPGSITGAAVTVSAPAGWTVTPAGPAAVGTVAAGASKSVAFNVTAPSGGGTAALHASATWDGGGAAVTDQGPPANLPPVIDSIDPTTASAGQQVTIHGSNFGATQGDSYVFFVDGGTSWGAPFDGAEFHVNSWSDTAVTFTVPTPSGPGGIWHVTPGDTAQVQVTTAAGSSAQLPLKIGG